MLALHLKKDCLFSSIESLTASACVTALTAGMVAGLGQEKYPGLLDDWAHVFEDYPAELAVYHRFKEQLAQQADTVDARNASRRYVLNDFNPKFTKCSISS